MTSPGPAHSPEQPAAAVLPSTRRGARPLGVIGFALGIVSVALVILDPMRAAPVGLASTIVCIVAISRERGTAPWARFAGLGLGITGILTGTVFFAFWVFFECLIASGKGIGF